MKTRDKRYKLLHALKMMTMILAVMLLGLSSLSCAIKSEPEKSVKLFYDGMRENDREKAFSCIGPSAQGQAEYRWALQRKILDGNFYYSTKLIEESANIARVEVVISDRKDQAVVVSLEKDNSSNRWRIIDFAR